MIVTVSARCGRQAAAAVPLAAASPYTSRLPPIHLRPAAQTPPHRRGFSQPSFAVPGAVRGGPPGAAPGPGICLMTAYSTVDNFVGNVDGEAAESFFHAQAVDGISAGSKGSGS